MYLAFFPLFITYSAVYKHRNVCRTPTLSEGLLRLCRLCTEILCRYLRESSDDLLAQILNNGQIPLTRPPLPFPRPRGTTTRW